MVSTSLQAALGAYIPENCEPVKYNPVKADHYVWDKQMEDYRQVRPLEVGLPLHQFLSVIRNKR